jgi:hypothetical protein
MPAATAAAKAIKAQEKFLRDQAKAAQKAQAALLREQVKAAKAAEREQAKAAKAAERAHAKAMKQAQTQTRPKARHDVPVLVPIQPRYVDSSDELNILRSRVAALEAAIATLMGHHGSAALQGAA